MKGLIFKVLNNNLNTLFILNMYRSDSLTESLEPLINIAPERILVIRTIQFITKWESKYYPETTIRQTVDPISWT